MNLKSMQEQFIRQLNHFQIDDIFVSRLKQSGSLLPEQQIAIYQNNVRGALQSCLAQVYPMCQKILGENYFKQLVSGYIQNNPSDHVDLNRYGKSFPDYILSQCQQKHELGEFPYLSDLVQFEWLYHHVYYAANASIFDFNAFAELTALQQARSFFTTVSCLEFLPSEYPILSIWELNHADENTPNSLPSQPENVCIFRKNNQIELFLIEPHVSSLLTLIKAEATLDQIVQANLDQLLPELIQQGWIGGFRVKNV